MSTHDILLAVTFGGLFSITTLSVTITMVVRHERSVRRGWIKHQTAREAV